MDSFSGNFDEHLSMNSFRRDSLTPVWEYRNVEKSYSFERIDIASWGDLVLAKRHWAYYAAGIYLVTIFALKKYMENRKPFDLRVPLIWWNLGLGIFSIVGFSRSFSYLSSYIGKGPEGFYESICLPDKTEPSMAFWGLAFCLSKYVELGDTVFIVLRKRPLQLLQWYHHIATLIITWMTMPFNEPVGRYFAIMNFGIHSVMYPYFALKMARFKIPKVISNVITTAQFAQMIIGFALNIITIALIVTGSKCYRSPVSIWASLVLYGTFVILFGQLFLNSVMRPKTQYKNKMA